MTHPGRGARTPDSPFWVEPEDVDLAEQQLKLGPDESHHLLHVFRAAPGTPFDAIDGRGSLFHCVLEKGTARAATARIESREENSGELPFSLELLVGLPDLPQAESIVEHAVPLGATVIDFVAVARSGREALPAARLERMLRIARSALKQSRRTRLPVLRSSDGLERALEGSESGGASAASPGPDEGPGGPVIARLMADPMGDFEIPLPSDVIQTTKATVIMAVGPPGGFLEEEWALLRNRQFASISLGPSRLSTSTATLAILGAVRNLLLASGFHRVDKNGLPGYLL
jgi:16S rRNA (uracil1498-N3)-methyltransferase